MFPATLDVQNRKVCTLTATIPGTTTLCCMEIPHIREVRRAEFLLTGRHPIQSAAAWKKFSPLSEPIMQVHLHKAIVEQVRVARRSLNRRSSMSSRPSSDWEEAHFPTKKYSWAAGADGALSPAGSLLPLPSGSVCHSDESYCCVTDVADQTLLRIAVGPDALRACSTAKVPNTLTFRNVLSCMAGQDGVHSMWIIAGLWPALSEWPRV